MGLINFSKPKENITGITEVRFTPTLIGKKFFYMYGDKIRVGLICDIQVNITTFVEEEKSWWEQLFQRMFHGTNEREWTYTWQYNCKTEMSINRISLTKKDNQMYLFSDTPIFFSEEELLKSLK